MPSTPAVSDASTAALIPIGSKSANVPVIEIKRPVFLIGGRKEAVKLHLDSSTVSKLHCVIVLNAWGCYVHDLGSRTGTLVNGQPVVDQDLNDGDEIGIGRFKFKFRAPRRTTPKPTPLPAADLTVSGLDLPLTAHKRVLTIGRRAGSDVEFDDKSVSNLHALIVEQDGRRLLRDLGSRTGTWIGDHPIHQEILPDGAGFRVGRQILTLTSRRAANELPLDEPIPLSEPPLRTATPGVVPTAGLGALDLGAIDFSAVEDLDHAGPAAVPADDDLSLVPLEEPHAAPEDDLAALRRNWQATPRPTADLPPVITPPLPAAPPAAPLVIPPVPPVLEPAARVTEPSHRPAVPTLEQPAAPVKPTDLPIVEHLPAPAGPPVVPPIVEAPAAEAPIDIEADDAVVDSAAAEELAADQSIAEVETDGRTRQAGFSGPVPPPEAPVADKADELARASETLELDLPEPPADAPDLDVLAEAPAPGEPPEAEPAAAEADELAVVSETLKLDLPPAPADAPDLDVLAEAEPQPAAETPAVLEPQEIAEDTVTAETAAAEPEAAAETATPIVDETPTAAETAAAEAPAAGEADVDELVLDPDAPETLDLDAVDLEALAPAAEAQAETEQDADALVLDPDAPAPAETNAAETAAPDRLAVADAVEAVDELSLAAEVSEAVADDLILGDGAEPVSPVVAEAPAAPTAEAPAAGAPDDDLIELELGDLEADADAAAEELLLDDGAAPTGPLVAETPTEPAAEANSAKTAPADLELELEPLDLSGLELALDPDSPAVAEVPADVDDLRLDPEAPVTPAAGADELAAEDAAAIAETSTAGVAGPASAAIVDDATADADATEQTLTEAVVAGSDETDVPWPSVAAADAAVLDLPPTDDKVDLAADKDFTDTEPATVAAAIVTPDVDLSDHPTPAEAAAETVAEHKPLSDDLAAAPADESRLPAGEREVAGIILDDAGLASAIGAEVDEAVDELHQSVAPGLADDAMAAARSSDAGRPVIEEPHHEPDLVRITDETDEDADDATALAVDLGLVLDDDIAPSEVPPAAPVDVDLTASRIGRPGGSIDLSRLGPTPGGANGQPAVAPSSEATSDEGPHEDVFDADSVEVVEPPAPLAPAAEAPKPAAPKPPKKDDEFSGPMGGSLADLIPSGPPLLGGSFMSLPPMAPVPSIPARGRPRRVGFGGEPARPSQRGPFSAQRTIADAIEPGSAVDDDEINLAPPPAPAAPSADAFSAPAARPPVAAPAGAEPALPAVSSRPRGTIRPVLPAEATYASQPGTQATPLAVALPAGPTEEELLQRAKLHKKRVRRVIACVLAMIVLIGGAAWGVLYFLPPTARVDALINFENLDRVSAEEQQLLRNRMNDMLASDSVRQDAIAVKPAGVDNGFLASPKQVFDAIDRDPKVRWPERSTFMRLRVHSLDKENDIVRVRALGQALVKTGDADRAKSGELAAAVRTLAGQIADKNQQLNDLNDQIQALKQAQAGRPAGKDLSALNAEYLAAEQALTTIKSHRQELDANVERLKKPAVAAPSSGPAIDPAAADQELAALTKQLTDVQQAVTKPTPVATEERKKLDAAFKELERQLAEVQGQKANPALVAYAKKVGDGFKQVRDMTEQLFSRQDRQRQQLADLKAKMSENQQAFTQRRMESDAELKKLRDGVELLTRRFNAAKASGEADLAEKTRLDLQIARIKADEAEEKAKSQDDPVFTPAIQGLQQLIDQQEADTRADRKNVNDRLAQLQGEFMTGAPDTGNLPADQKQLAENIQKKLTAMNEARRATAEAEEKALAEQAKAEAAANEMAADLRTKIAARRQDVLAAARARQAEQDETTRRQLLADAQAELTSVRQQEQVAAHRLTDAATAIEAAERQKRIDAQSEVDYKAKIAARDNVDRDRRQAQNALADKQAALAKLIVPDREVEVHSADDPDRRPMVFATVAGTSVVLLLIPILLNLMALAREAQLPYANLVAEIDPDADEGFEPLLPEPARAGAAAKQLPEPAHS